MDIQDQDLYAKINYAKSKIAEPSKLMILKRLDLGDATAAHCARFINRKIENEKLTDSEYITSFNHLQDLEKLNLIRRIDKIEGAKAQYYTISSFGKTVLENLGQRKKYI